MNCFIDIHTHSYYQDEKTKLLLNVFPEETEKFQHPCYFSVGLHPWHVHADSVEANLKWIEKHIDNTNVLAIGEIGLDKTIAAPWKDQVYAFEKQLALAEVHCKPVILHCVRSYNELILYRNASNQQLPWIFHWFNASFEIARELIRKNCYLSFGHMLFNENSKAYSVFTAISADSIFLETDDAGHTIQEISDRAALIKGMHLSQLMQQINNNFTRCFGTI